MTRFGRQRWALMELFDIPNGDGVTYMRRWRLVQTPLLSLYLHRFYLPDWDRDPHDHPWAFVSLVLRGGYEESLHERGSFLRRRRRRRGSVAWFPLRRAHKVETVDAHTTTLLLVGPAVRAWGFWRDGRWVEWREYRAQQRAAASDGGSVTPVGRAAT